MARTTTATTGKWTASAAPLTQPRGTIACWIYTTSIASAQNRHHVTISDNSENNRMTLGLDPSAANTGKVAATLVAGGSAESGLAGVPALSTWECHGAIYAGYPNNATAREGNGAGDVTPGAPAAGNLTPLSLAKWQINGRNSDNLFGNPGQYALVMIFDHPLSGIEWDYLRKGGNPRAIIGFLHGDRLTTTGAGTDMVQTGTPINLTESGTSAGSSEPIVAPWWTAAAPSALSLTQGTDVPAIDLTTKFDTATSAVHYTASLMKIGAAGTASKASGAGTSTTQICQVASTASFAINGCAKNAAGTLCQILHILGTQLLLAQPITWADQENITPVAVTAQSVTFYAGGNAWGGTGHAPGSGDVGSYPQVFWRAADTTTGTLVADSPIFSMAIAGSGSNPSFTAAPTETAKNTDGQTFGATSNQSSVTWHIGYYKKGSAQPSNANLKGAAGTGFVAHFTKALSAATPDTTTTTGLLLPGYDVYHLLNHAVNGDSAVVVQADTRLAPAAGKQFVTAAGIISISAITKANPMVVTTVTPHGRTSADPCELFNVGGMVEAEDLFNSVTVIDANNVSFDNVDSSGFTTFTSGGTLSFGQSIDNGASTPIANGDIRIVDLVTDLGSAIQVNGDGTIDVLPLATQRHKFTHDAYSVSGGALLGTNTISVNNQNPVPPNTLGGLTALTMVGNQAGASANAGTLWSDPQGDTVKLTSVTGLPSGASFDSNTGLVSGNIAPGIYPVSALGGNDSGEPGTSGSFNLVVTPVQVPDLGVDVGNQSTATSTLEARYFVPQFGTQDDNRPGGPAPAGTIIAQSPLALQSAAYGATVFVTLSTGNSSTGNPTPPPTGVTKSPQLVTAEATTGLGLYELWEGFGLVTFGSTDPSGEVSQVCRIPAGARVTDVEVMNDANPGGTDYRIGVVDATTGKEVVTGSSVILAPSIPMDTVRKTWTSVYAPALAGGVASLDNVGLYIWQLLGLPADPSPVAKDAFYTVAVTAIKPGSAGGRALVRVTGRLATRLRSP